MTINIDDLTLGQIKEIRSLPALSAGESFGLNDFIGQMVIVRTYSAGVWFGQLNKKSGNEVILIHARRMWKWWAKESISLSAVAIHGINEGKSKIVAPLENGVWLEAIEIIPCSPDAIKSLEDAVNAKAE